MWTITPLAQVFNQKLSNLDLIRRMVLKSDQNYFKNYDTDEFKTKQFLIFLKNASKLETNINLKKKNLAEILTFYGRVQKLLTLPSFPEPLQNCYTPKHRCPL